jgi:putative glutamine amidotransferase
LIVSATSPDGVIEAVEWKDKEDEAWMLCVQWHPERMTAGAAVSTKVREVFLKEVIVNH